jgi:hypothetical protein
MPDQAAPAIMNWKQWNTGLGRVEPNAAIRAGDVVMAGRVDGKCIGVGAGPVEGGGRAGDDRVLERLVQMAGVRVRRRPPLRGCGQRGALRKVRIAKACVSRRSWRDETELVEDLLL